MKEYQGKVVAITGAANGIGREIVLQLAEKGVKFSLADIQAEPLVELASWLEAKGVEVISSCFDVSDYEAMQDFAHTSFAHYGTVDYFFNNAGISAIGNAWKMPLSDWDWLLDVNIKGVVHGIKSFMPEMIKQDKECYFITTASAAGLVTLWGGAGYAASKHAVVGMAETLELDLRKAGAKVKSYVICPSFVLSNLHNSLDYRPAGQWDKNDPAYQDADYIEADERSIQSTGVAGMPTAEAVKIILQELDADKFLILTHSYIATLVEARFRNLLSGKRPGA